MPNPYLLLAIGIAWLASVVGIGVYEHQAGAIAERVKWQVREAKQDVAANLKIRQLQDAARATEQRAAQDLAAVAERYEKEKSDVAASKDRVISDLRSGALRLRFPTATTGDAGRSQAAATAAGAGECDGRAAGELPQPVAEFLVSLASEADSVVVQLMACQAVVRQDRQDVILPAPPESPH